MPSVDYRTLTACASLIIVQATLYTSTERAISLFVHVEENKTRKIRYFLIFETFSMLSECKPSKYRPPISASSVHTPRHHFKVSISNLQKWQCGHLGQLQSKTLFTFQETVKADWKEDKLSLVATLFSCCCFWM